MFVLMAPRDRAEPGDEAERVAAFRQMVACSGPFRQEPPDRFVITVDVAWFAPWVGAEQVRSYRIDGDRMDVVSAPTRLPQGAGTASTVVATLFWVRESSAPA